MRKRLVILLLLSWFHCMCIAQQTIVNQFDKENKTAATDINDSSYYQIQIKPSAPKNFKNNIRLKALRQVTDNDFIISGLFLKNIPAQNKFIKHTQPAGALWKLSENISQISSSKEERDKQYRYYLQATNASVIEAIKNLLQKEEKLQHAAGQNIFSLLTTYNRIEKLFLNNNNIIFIDVIKKNPAAELGTPGFDLSANKINLVQNKYPAVTGGGMHVSIKEEYYDTTDIDIKGRYEISPLASKNITNHANFIATIIAGAGNSVYYAKGVAPQAFISSSSFEQILPEAEVYYKQNNITVQNHSYGADIDNEYGLNAVAFDKSANADTNLLHILSSGNSGTTSSTNGIYTAINEYANLTGNFKMAKNIITVGAVDSLGKIVPLSSSGPAYDGRIKPELTAFQQNGTSEAAALVSGTTLLLQQYYKSLHGTALPSALAKAILINSADDINIPGPDYKTGFGNLNAFAAMNLIKANTIAIGTVSQDEKKIFSIDVPANAVNLKLTLAWNDTAATAASPKALVNDLDMELTMPANTQSWKPWVLNSFPNIDSLRLPAIRKKDSLNNVEQITIENPAAGNYQIEINGYDIATAGQPFYIAYSWDTANEFTWQRPAKTDFAEAKTKSILRWQTTFSGSGDIEYSLADNNWLPVASNIDLTKNYLYWNVPDTISPALIRVKINNQYFYSDTFIITTLLKPTTGFICGDSVFIYWNKIKNISSYQLYRLGEKYLGSFATVTDTTAIIAKSILNEPYIAVAPVLNGTPAIKSYAFDYTKQGAGCFINSFYTDNNNNTAGLHLTLGTLFNIASISFEKQNASGYTTIASPLLNGSLRYDAGFSPLKNGINYFRVKIVLANGQIIYSNNEAVYYATAGQYVLFPVPVKRNNDINIITASPEGETISIIDAAGRIILQQKINTVKEIISTSLLQPGLYFYRITKNGLKVSAGKLIVL